MTATSEPITLAVRFEPEEHGWVRARVPHIPEIVTCGRDLDQARAMVCDALRELILAYMEPPDATDTRTGGERMIVTITAPGAPRGA